MKQKIAITLDEELVIFLDAQANGNRSDYLNSLLGRQRKLCLDAELIAALKDDVEDKKMLHEIFCTLWGKNCHKSKYIKFFQREWTGLASH